MAPQQYRVRVPLRGVDTDGGKGIATIPEGAILRIVDHPDDYRFITVSWEDRNLLVFRQDFCERTVERSGN